LLHGKQGQQGPLTQRDQALDAICESCIKVSEDLISKLEKLKISSDAKYRKWETFKSTFKSVRSKEKIEEIAVKLAKLRSELDSHVIISLR
jgi:hypothetical protein